MTETFHLPTRPYSVIDAINRYAAATGSITYAAQTGNADYNGHAVSVYYNSYRGYWLAEYTWAGRNVLCRGDLVECLRAAKREHDRGALGSSVTARYPDKVPSEDRPPSESPEDFAKACREAGFLPDNELPPSDWYTDLHKKVPDAFSMQRHGLAPAVGMLANSKTVEEYEAKVDAYVAEMRAKRNRG